MPFPILAVGGLGALLTTVVRYVFLAHIASFVARAFVLLGISWFTNETIVDPLLDMIRGQTSGVPAQLAEWLSAFGFDRVISIIASAYTMLATKRLFLGKSG